MPPTTRLVPSFAAEPPQEPLPYGRWAETLRRELLAACLSFAADEVGDVGEISWYPDRTWQGRTYVPATAPTERGYEVFGYVSFATPVDDDAEPSGLAAHADYTSETAARNADWTLDLSDEVIGRWRGEEGRIATMTLVWGRPLVAGGAVATAELADLAVDQCPLVEDRFTLVAPDDYRGDYLDVKLFSARGEELARESLYVEDDEDAPAEGAAP